MTRYILIDNVYNEVFSYELSPHHHSIV